MHRLYKYFPPARARDALGDLTLRVSPSDALNDPFEARARLEAIFEPLMLTWAIRQHGPWGKLVSDSLRDSLPSQLRRYWPSLYAERVLGRISGVARFGQAASRQLNRAMLRASNEHGNALRHLIDRALDEHLRALGVISFTSVPTSTLMWAHYGESGKGFLLEYDPAHELFRGPGLAQPLGRLRPVRYYDRLPPVSIRYTPIHAEALRLAPEAIFLRKLSTWRYEREIRVLHNLATADEVRPLPSGELLHLKQIPPSAVLGVVFGPRSSRSLVDELRAYVAENARLSHVVFYQVAVPAHLQRPVMRRVPLTEQPG